MAGLIHLPLDYGFFNALKLVWKRSREKRIAWFLQQYTIIAKRCKGHEPHVVAHSLGSYIVAEAMKGYHEVSFKNIVFCGSIVATDYPWNEIIQRKQVHGVLNCCGRKDFWSKIVGIFVRDAGPSGVDGFLQTANNVVLQIGHKYFKHSDYLYAQLLA